MNLRNFIIEMLSLSISALVRNIQCEQVERSYPAGFIYCGQLAFVFLRY